MNHDQELNSANNMFLNIPSNTPLGLSLVGNMFCLHPQNGHSVRVPLWRGEPSERTTISTANHQSVLSGRVDRRKVHQVCQKSIWKTLREVKLSKEVQRFKSLPWIHGMTFGGHQAPLITKPIASLLWSQLVAALHCGDVLEQQTTGD